MIDRPGDFDRWEQSAWELAELTDEIRRAWLVGLGWFGLALVVVVLYLTGWWSRLSWFVA